MEELKNEKYEIRLNYLYAIASFLSQRVELLQEREERLKELLLSMELQESFDDLVAYIYEAKNKDVQLIFQELKSHGYGDAFVDTIDTFIKEKPNSDEKKFIKNLEDKFDMKTKGERMSERINDKQGSTIFKDMEDDINSSTLDEVTKKKLYENILKLKEQKVNLMVTGATGCGKSSTINAMFNTEIAKVGVGVDPETMEIKKYELDNLILWDSPGLGDGKEKDIQHSKGIIKKLNELDKDGNPLIDLVLVILDGGTRDLGTSYELINQVIIPNLGKNTEDRILIAINQADVAMKGRYWDFENNKPEPKLVDFLEEKVTSVKNRVKEATGVDVEPIYYSAGYKDGDEEQRPWNLSKLLYFIVKNTPTEKRLSYADNISDNKEMWEDDDGLKDYTKEVQKSFAQTVAETAKAGGDIGKEIGEVFGMGKTGEAIGKVAGAAAGAIKAAWGTLRSWW